MKVVLRGHNDLKRLVPEWLLKLWMWLAVGLGLGFLTVRLKFKFGVSGHRTLDRQIDARELEVFNPLLTQPPCTPKQAVVG